uniref:Uncharacterized protein n=1 Tax=Timema shepardi TaxID=629360 RepID=A0A7R9AWJ3_TIMSH|nr:unnamed protein product [Timema shepardi]
MTLGVAAQPVDPNSLDQLLGSIRFGGGPFGQHSVGGADIYPTGGSLVSSTHDVADVLRPVPGILSPAPLYGDENAPPSVWTDLDAIDRLICKYSLQCNWRQEMEGRFFHHRWLLVSLTTVREHRQRAWETVLEPLWRQETLLQGAASKYLHEPKLCVVQTCCKACVHIDANDHHCTEYGGDRTRIFKTVKLTPAKTPLPGAMTSISVLVLSGRHTATRVAKEEGPQGGGTIYHTLPPTAIA